MRECSTALHELRERMRFVLQRDCCYCYHAADGVCKSLLGSERVLELNPQLRDEVVQRRDALLQLGVVVCAEGHACQTGGSVGS